jgi:hypothetical protein
MYGRAMKPDPLTPSRQGTGDELTDKTGQTTPIDDIPPEHRAMEGAKDGPTAGVDVGGTSPSVRHPNRPERKKEGGNFNGPDKPRGR